MRYTLLLTLGLLLSCPADSSASCWGRCSGCYGGYYGGCYGSCSGSRCYGCYGGQYGYGSYVYGGYAYGTSQGTVWVGNVSGYNTGSYYHNGYYRPTIYQYRPTVSATRTSSYYDASSTLSRKVKLEVVVADPAGSITIEGAATISTGTQRIFESPELETGKPFNYRVDYQSRDGNSRESRNIVVQAGEHVVVDFTRPAPAVSSTINAEALTMPESRPKRHDAAK